MHILVNHHLEEDPGGEGSAERGQRTIASEVAVQRSIQQGFAVQYIFKELQGMTQG